MKRFLEEFTLRPDLRRGFRTAIAFSVPLLICHWLGRPSDALFLAMSAQIIALPDLRGAYGARLTILAAITVVVIFCAVLGVYSGGNIYTAIVASGLIGLLGGVWRHLSSDYGPQLSVASALLFLLGLSQPGTFAEASHLAGLIAIAGAGTAILHVSFWLFRPQHPLRFAVAETWMAVADLINGLRPNLENTARKPVVSMIEKERELREALDRTFAILGAAENKHRTALLEHLEEMRREVVHLAMRITGLQAAMEPVLGETRYASLLPTLDSVLLACGNMARSVAYTLVSHRRENFATTEVRIQRCLHLIQVLNDQLAGEFAADEIPQLTAALENIARILPRIGKTLQTTIDHGEVIRSFPTRLPDLSSVSMRSVGSWINPADQIDPVLLRHSLRMAILMMGSVAIYKGFQIHHGYWIAFTTVVVLQPDYGSTRNRAIQRVGGTFAGSVLGSILLWVKMPLLMLDGLAGIMSFGFAYFSKTRYGLAVFFVTLLIVLITETTGPIHLDFTVSRLLCNALGGALALVSALVFWPIWEGEKFSTLLGLSVRANRDYLSMIGALLTDPEMDPDRILTKKRRAENANRFASASLQRLVAEPATSEKTADLGTALTTYNQKITRGLTSIAVHLQEHPGKRNEAEFEGQICVLDELLGSVHNAVIDAKSPEIRSAQLETQNALPTPQTHQEPGTPNDLLIANYLTKCIAECGAMKMVLQQKVDK